MIDANCPYNCNSLHQILDRQQGHLVPCPHCADFAEDEVLMNENIYSKLGFPDSINLTAVIDPSNLVPPSELPFLKPGTVEDVVDFTHTVWGCLSQGVLPPRSCIIGLGIKGRYMNIAYPLLAAAYASGLATHPLITASRVSYLKLRDQVDEINELISTPVVVIVIEEGVTRSAVQVCKGLMQERALIGYPTIFVTTAPLNAVTVMIDLDPSAGSTLAFPSFVEYIQGTRDKYSRYTQGALGVENEYQDSDENSTESF